MHNHDKFFKSRNYLLLEFPFLLKIKNQIKLVEFGCGTGSSIIPLLKSLPKSTCHIYDISQSAINLCIKNALKNNIDTNCIKSTKIDLTIPHSKFSIKSNPFHNTNADFLFLVKINFLKKIIIIIKFRFLYYLQFQKIRCVLCWKMQGLV